MLPRAYLHYARCAFQRRTAYRLANWSGIAVNFFFFLIHAQVFFAFFGKRTEVAGWRPQDAVLYFATSESLMMVLGVMSAATGMEMVERVRKGDVSVDLVRPIRLWSRFVAEGYGNALYYAVSRAWILYLAAVLLYGLVPPLHAELVLFPLSLLLAIGVSGALMFLAGATAFWTEQAHGPLTFVLLATFFFGGITIPLDFYPTPARVLTEILPFRAAVYTPIALATGKLSGGALVYGLSHQVFWLAALWVAADRLERRGLAHLAAVGG